MHNFLPQRTVDSHRDIPQQDCTRQSAILGMWLNKFSTKSEGRERKGHTNYRITVELIFQSAPVLNYDGKAEWVEFWHTLKLVIKQRGEKQREVRVHDTHDA